MKFALFVSNQHPPGTNMLTALDEQIQMVHAIRDHGWDTVWVGQHFLSTLSQTQPVPFLARLATEAGDMDLGLGIQLIALLNPVHVAEEIATLDIMCRGKFIYGIGLGYRDVEYNAFAIPDGTRVERFEKNLEIILKLWAGESITVDLPWCKLDNASLTTVPLQQPRPELWVAANSDKAVLRAARIGDTWMINPHARMETVANQLELFHAERAAHQLPPAKELPAFKEIFCAPTRKEAIELAAPFLGEKYQTYQSWGQHKALPGDESFDLPFEQLEEDRFIIGSPEDCIRQLLPWRDELKINNFVFRTHWSGMPASSALQSINLLSHEVIPVLKG